MKKYKLIKELPFQGSPKLNFILDDKLKVGYSKNVYSIEGISFIPENYPEFWQEVVEKDYEILSFRSLEKFKHGHLIHMNQNNFKPEKYLSSPDYWEIHSIKRLSDNEVFTVGDFIKVPDCSEKCIIQDFELIDDNKLYVNYYYKHKDDGHLCTGDLFSLRIIERYKKPLFTTEDGVDIYPNTRYTLWFITKDKRSINPFLIRQVRIQNKNHIYKDDYVFYDKKAAEEYIINNKPCLSYNDIFNEYVFSIRKNSLSNNLKKLIKSRLNT